MKTAALALAGATVLTSCAVTVPVAVFSDRDGTLRGTSTATRSEGAIRVANERLTCMGSYDPLTQTPTIGFALECSDGRRGFVVVTRTNPTSGHGTVRMSDGSTATLVFGDAAAAF
jgi:hypothetical protein